MRINDDVKEIKQELIEIKQESFALELLGDYKKQNKRLFIIILVLIGTLILETSYLVWLLNDISEVETSEQEITDVDTINNSSIINGN